MKTISLSNFKGGVGKTTLTKNIGTCFARLGYKTLLIDFDPQQNLTKSFNDITKLEMASTIYDAIFSGNGKPINISNNLDIFPADVNLSVFERNVMSDNRLSLNPNGLLARVLKQYSTQYDICLIDTRPALDLTVRNAFCASDKVIIPITPSRFSYEGFTTLIDVIAMIREALNENLSLLGIVMNKYNRNFSSSEDIDVFLGDANIAVFQTKIRDAEAFLYTENKSISVYEQNRNSLIKMDITSLTNEIISKLNND